MQLLTRGHKTLGRNGYLSFGSRIIVHSTLIVKSLRNPQRFIPPPLSLSVKRQPTHIQAHLVLPDTQSRPFAKPKELEISEAIHEHQ